jgi:hypothetical protein
MYEMKDFPPSIQELLKKRGWNWPPDKELQKKMDEAFNRLAGSIHVEDPEIVREILWEMRGIRYDSDKKKLS